MNAVCLSRHSRKKQVIKISYNSLKKHNNQLLEELSTTIVIAVSGKKPSTLMGDYSLNYFKKLRDCPESVLVPYGLQVLNTDHPTRVQGTSKYLINYIINDYLQANTFKF